MMPNGWNSVPLGEVVNYRKGFAFKSENFKDAGRRIIRISDTTASSIKNDSLVFVAEDNSLKDFELNSNDIILSTVGSRPPLYDSMVGKAIKVPSSVSGAYLNQNLVKLIPDEKVNHDFLFTKLKEPRFISYISTLVRGNANQVSITLDELFNYQLLLPPKNEQEKIAKILSTWDEAIEKIEQLENYLADMAHFLSSKVFSSSGNKKIKISDALDFLRDGTHGTHANVDSGIPLLSAKDVGADGKITMRSPRLISESEYRKIHSKYEINAGDVLLTIVGTIGRVAIVPEKSDKFSVQRSVAILRPNKSYRSDYLYYFLRSYITQKQLQKSANASAQAGIYLGELAKLEIEYLSLEEQEKAIEKLKVLDHRLHLTRSIRANLQNQKQGLMQQLLTGKKRVKL